MLAFPLKELTIKNPPPLAESTVGAPAAAPASCVHFYKLQLFVAGDTPNCAQALANITALCKAHLLDCHNLEVIDVFSDPDRALAQGIVVTPTLVRLESGVSLKIVGTLSDTAAVLSALGLPHASA